MFTIQLKVFVEFFHRFVVMFLNCSRSICAFIKLPSPHPLSPVLIFNFRCFKLFNYWSHIKDGDQDFDCIGHMDRNGVLFLYQWRICIICSYIRMSIDFFSLEFSNAFKLRSTKCIISHKW
jgi:hypothetical protein